MSAYMMRTGYRYRVFVGKTSDKPASPEKQGDIFVDVETAKNYIGLAGAWEETSIVITL